MAGACVAAPSNDECAGATPVTLLAGTTTVTGSTATFTHSTANTCGAGADVYYRFTLTQREIVYLDTFGSTYDTEVGFVTTCGGAVTGCNDDSCSVLQSQTTATLDPGTYNIVVGGFSGSGSYTLHIQHLPVPTGAATGTVNMGMSTIAGDNTGAPTFNLGCGAAGATRYYTWLTCPAAPAGTFTATTCSGGAAFDTVLAERNGDTGTVACNDDNCGLQSTVNATVAAGAGVHVFYASGFGGAAGTFTATVTRP
jgi:hypothetical protein